jgi:hypothetical protein
MVKVRYPILQYLLLRHLNIVLVFIWNPIFWDLWLQIDLGSSSQLFYLTFFLFPSSLQILDNNLYWLVNWFGIRIRISILNLIYYYFYFLFFLFLLFLFIPHLFFSLIRFLLRCLLWIFSIFLICLNKLKFLIWVTITIFFFIFYVFLAISGWTLKLTFGLIIRILFLEILTNFLFP